MIHPSVAHGPPDRQQVIPSRVVAPHQLLCRLAQARHQLVVPLSKAAHMLVQGHGAERFGAVNLSTFTRVRFERSSWWLRDLAALHECITRYPALMAALCGRDGCMPIGRVAARCIGRVATKDNIHEWISLARSLSIHELRQRVREALRGDPGDLARNGNTPDHTEQPSNGCSHPDVVGGGNATVEDSEVQDLSTTQFMVPRSVDLASHRVEELHQARSNTTRRADFIEALVGEWRSGDHKIMPDGQHARDARFTRFNINRTGTSRPNSLRCQNPGLKPPLPEAKSDPSAEGYSMNGVMLEAYTTLVQIEEYLGESKPNDRTKPKSVVSLTRASSPEISAMSPTARATLPETSATSPTARPRVSPQINELRDAEAMLQEVMHLENEIEIRMGDLLLLLDLDSAWRPLGFNNAAHYGEECLRMSATVVRTRLRLARAMEKSQELREAYESQTVGKEKAARLAGLLLANKALSSGHIKKWIEHSSAITLKRMDEEFKALERRAGGGSPFCSNRAFRKPTIRSEDQGSDRTTDVLTPLTFTPLTDDDWFQSIRLTPGDCSEFLLNQSFLMLKHLRDNEVAADVLIRFRLPADVGWDLVCCIEEARRELEIVVGCAASCSPDEEARERPSVRMARAYLERGKRIPDWLGYLALLEEYALEWDNPKTIGKRPRDVIHNRDGWRCTAPGCVSRVLEVHHVKYRSRGGGDEEANLICLCAFHHRMGEHGEWAQVRGTAPLGLIWRLGHPDLAVWYHNERRIDVPHYNGDSYFKMN